MGGRGRGQCTTVLVQQGLPTAPFRGATGTKGSFSTTERDSKGVMKWNSVDEGKECRGSYEEVPECSAQFLVSSVPCFVVVIATLPISFSLGLFLHARVRERAEGGQWSNGAVHGHLGAAEWGRGRWMMWKGEPHSTEGEKAEGWQRTLGRKMPVSSGVKRQGVAWRLWRPLWSKSYGSSGFFNGSSGPNGTKFSESFKHQNSLKWDTSIVFNI